MAIHEIEPIDALGAIRKIEKRGKLESARRTWQLASAVFRYAVATARLKSDPTRDLRGALTVPKVTHYGAVTDASRVGQLLRSIDGNEGQGMTKWGLQLSPHVFVRPGELRHARWDEIDLEGALWIIPAEKMKMRKPHQVPLCRQSIVILQEIRSITGPWGYVFPSMRSRTRPMSENTLNAALRRLGNTPMFNDPDRLVRRPRGPNIIGLGTMPTIGQGLENFYRFLNRMGPYAGTRMLTRRTARYCYA